MGSGGPPRSHPLRLRLSAPPGALAADPERVARAVIAAARADGAGPDWSDRLVKAAGGSTRSMPVNGDPRYQLLRDVVTDQQRVYALAMESAVDKITALLEAAAASADAPEP